MKLLSLLVLLLPFTGFAQDLPDAPSFAGHPDSKWFWTAHAGLLAATVFDAEVTHQGLAHHKCVEGNSDLPHHPTRGELYGYSLGIDAGLTALDYLLFRKLGHGTHFAGAAYGIIVHVQGGSSWYTQSCF